MPERKRFVVAGIVQGVGFRPFVHALAGRLGLSGFVGNNSEGVVIEVEGTAEVIDEFARQLEIQSPPLSLITKIRTESIPVVGVEGFEIITSDDAGSKITLVSPDIAICGDCRRELFAPADRRRGHPFINCTNCGPRFSIIDELPYDREKTSMKIFPMCGNCLEEYETPSNRRFHAQPVACPDCGPELALLEGGGAAGERAVGVGVSVDGGKVNCGEGGGGEVEICRGGEAVRMAAGLIAEGRILAVKGIGGFHLACDALNEQACATLRQRKHREDRPFAVMVPDVETARKMCYVSDAEERALLDSSAPIVLLKIRPDAEIKLPDVISSPLDTYGLMLPYTPLHCLLMSETGGRPLVMTSGNRSGEPIAYRNEIALEQLSGIADFFLTHDRPIRMRVDDSVVRIFRGKVRTLRRSRGFAPAPLILPYELKANITACGADLKNVFCIARGGMVFPGRHIGDLDSKENIVDFEGAVEHFERLFDFSPDAIAYDMHPDYLSSLYALERIKTGLRGIAVQHHHAHFAACLADNGESGPAIGVIMDGVGWGLDGTAWGGEFLVGDFGGFRRAGFLTPIPLPGGDAATVHPWRMAASYMYMALGKDFTKMDIEFTRQMDVKAWDILRVMIDRGVNSPLTSGMGRLFDAVSAMIHFRERVNYEGQAAIELEALCGDELPGEAYEYNVFIETGQGQETRKGQGQGHGKDKGQRLKLRQGQEQGRETETEMETEQLSWGLPPYGAPSDIPPLVLDTMPVIVGIANDLEKGVRAPVIAARFHSTVVRMITDMCCRIRESTGLNAVTLSGGVFQNFRLLEETLPALEAEGFRTMIHSKAPPNDGGLCLGQVMIAEKIFSS